ncbi:MULTISPECIES: hypothetical protein [unclassified Paenibacillus]|uniref:hypothetical protein n=1 Tax=unclassified Paenibacillus TaxID=185978 RepID=UPI001E58D10C|nr:MULTISPECIES: hypothetical protein [unclassified Paenibacillus]
MRLNKTFVVGIILILIGIAWGLLLDGIGMREWLLLLSGIVLGIIAGLVQRWAVVRQRLGLITPDKKRLWIIGVIVVLVIVKVAINVFIPSYLATSNSGIYLSIVYAIGGLLLGHALYLRFKPMPQPAKLRDNRM